MCANNILMHALRIMVALLCIALTRVCEAIRKCHGMKLVGVTLLTLRSGPELESVLFFVDTDIKCDSVIDMRCIICNLLHLRLRTFHICRSALSLSTFACASISFFGSFNHLLPCHDSSLRILEISLKYFVCYLVIIIFKAAVTSPFSLSGHPSSSLNIEFSLHSYFLNGVYNI